MGLGSFLLVMGVFFAYAWHAWRRMERDSDLEPRLLGLAGALLGAMVGGLVDPIHNLELIRVIKEVLCQRS